MKQFFNWSYYSVSVADPGFPIGGAPTHWGGTDLQCVHFLVKTYAKTKEMDPVGGGVGGWRALAAPLPPDPPMCLLKKNFFHCSFAGARTELTDGMLQALSRKISSEPELTKLGITGLGMESTEITRIINDNRKFTSAVLEVLNEWKKAYQDNAEAYKVLFEALGKVGLNNFRKVLK